MQLRLQTHGQLIAQYPVGELPGVEVAIRRREQHGANGGQVPLLELLAGPPVIRFAAQNEFNLVPRVEMGKVGPQVFRYFAEPGVLMSSMRDTRESTAATSSAPLVSSETE